jgi:hypothetical protein
MEATNPQTMRRAKPPLAAGPPFLTGLFNPWKFHTKEDLPVVTFLQSSDANYVFCNVQLPPDSDPRYKYLSLAVPICDNNSLQLTLDRKMEYIAVEVHKISFSNLNLTEDSAFAEHKKWANKTNSMGAPSLIGEEVDSGGDLVNLAKKALDENVLPVYATGYIQHKLASVLIINRRGGAYERGYELQRTETCSNYETIRPHFFSNQSVAGAVAAMTMGGTIGWLRSGTARQRNEKAYFALKQLKFLGNTQKLEPIDKLHAIRASRALIPAKVVDQGALAVVRWITSRKKSVWKKYRALSSIALLSLVTSRNQIGAFATSFAAGEAVARSDDRYLDFKEKDLITHAPRDEQTANSIIRAFTGISLAQMKYSNVAVIRKHVIRIHENVLEVLFTDGMSGEPYSKKVLLRRLTLFPQLLRYVHKGAKGSG